MAKKIHTQAKRRLTKIGRSRAPRPKTFTTEEKALAYAKLNGIEKFELVAINPNKIKIVQ